MHLSRSARGKLSRSGREAPAGRDASEGLGGDTAVRRGPLHRPMGCGSEEMRFCCLKSVARKRDLGKGGMLVEALLGRLNLLFLGALCGVLELQNFCSYSHLYSP